MEELELKQVQDEAPGQKEDDSNTEQSLNEPKTDLNNEVAKDDE